MSVISAFMTFVLEVVHIRTYVYNALAKVATY